MYDGDTFEHEGLTFTVRLQPDESMGPPWEEHDGHGPVSEWTTRGKRPGELVLSRDNWGRSKRYYDFAAACRMARAEGWDAKPYNTGHETKRQQAAKAAMADFKRLQAWCEDHWCWCGVIITCEDLPGEPSASLWGIESDAGDYFREVAEELADEIIAQAAAEVACAVA
jgi:hypothetical protein